MAHAKNIGEPFMARAKNLYNIPCCMFVLKSVILFSGVGNSHQEVASYHNIVKNYEKHKKYY